MALGPHAGSHTTDGNVYELQQRCNGYRRALAEPYTTLIQRRLRLQAGGHDWSRNTASVPDSPFRQGKKPVSAQWCETEGNVGIGLDVGWLLGAFQADDEGSIPFTRSNKINDLNTTFRLHVPGIRAWRQYGYIPEGGFCP